MTHVTLDISRLVSRIRHNTPSGVDRVEMAYARGLSARYGASLNYALVHPLAGYGRIGRDQAERFLDMLEDRWRQPADGPDQRSLASILPTLLSLRPMKPQPPGNGHVLVQSSPHHLDQPDLVARILAQERARFLCLVHDLIPIEYPEYARETGAATHRKRIETVVRHADGVLTNSQATARSFAPWLEREGRDTPVRVALLGTEPLEAPERPKRTEDKPYFVCIGTIEPRKNHLLLLHLFRDLANTLPPEQVPRLLVIGRRGWENEQVIDLLERSTALKGHVEELNGCSDAHVTELLSGSRGLLMPTFAEGFGMPVAEALSLGVPVICSDLPVLHEVGGEVPTYIDPLDGLGWKAAIMDFAHGGPMHSWQMQRLTTWTAPSWDDHIEIVAEEIEKLAALQSR